MTLPTEVRETLIVMLDEYLEEVNDEPDGTDLATIFVKYLITAAEEAGVEDAEEIDVTIEEECELEEPLHNQLELEFSNSDEFDLVGEEILDFAAKLCQITWEGEDEELDALGENLEMVEGYEDD